MENGIGTIYCCGLPFDHNLGLTAENGALAGFTTYVITDACKSLSDTSTENMNSRILNAGVYKIYSD